MCHTARNKETRVFTRADLPEATQPERKLIGYVSVDSGMLLLIDPVYLCADRKEREAGYECLPEAAELGDACLDSCRSSMAAQIGSGTWGSAVGFRTGMGDGIFPVYREGYRIVIDLDEPHWDLEDGTGLVRQEPQSAMDRSQSLRRP